MQLQNINPDVQRILGILVFNQEYNENYPDDYFNAGGFFGHWDTYSLDEQVQLISQAKEQLL